MTLSSAVANYGLSAIATPTSTNVANDVRIGVAPASVGFPTADVAYSFKVTSTVSGDKATLAYDTGSVAQTTGTPTILDGDGKDFEGVTIAMPKLHGVIIQCTSGTVQYANSIASLPSSTLFAGDSVFNFLTDTLTVTGGTLILTTAGTATYTVTVIGKSS